MIRRKVAGRTVASTLRSEVRPDAENGRHILRRICGKYPCGCEGIPQRFYSISAQIRAERKTYYDMLESSQKSDINITQWLEWFLGCLDRAFSGAETILAAVLEKAEFWKRHAAARINDRQRDMLNRLLDGFEGKLTSSKWATIEKCSPDTALRDIQDLVDQGILAKDEGGGRSTSYSLVSS